MSDNYTKKESKIFSVSLLFLFVYFMGIYLPIIFIYFPVIAKLRIVLLSGSMLLASFLITIKQHENKKAFKNIIFKLWIGFFIITAFSILYSMDRGRTFELLIGLLKHFVPFIVMIRIVDSNAKLDTAIGVFAACGA